MSSYHLSIKSGKKGTALNHANYITRKGKYENDDLVAIEYGNLPTWSNNNPSTFWGVADRNERANGAAYREYELALPRELSTNQQQQLLSEFIKIKVGNKPFLVAIHAPIAALGGAHQPHCHLMVSDRMPDTIVRPAELHFKRHNSAKPELGGCKKDSGGKSRAELKNCLVETRKTWADLQNAALEKAGIDARVDHRSNMERGIGRIPERHLGQSGIKKMSGEDKVRFKEKRQCGHANGKVSA